MDWNTFSAIATGIGGVAAAVAAYFSFRAVTAAHQQIALVKEQLQLDHRFRKMEIHARLLSDGREIQASFPPEIKNANWQPSERDKRQILLFWYHIFDEWAICKRDSSDLGDLWDRYYRKGAASAIKRPQFRDSLKELLDTSELFGAAREFSQEMDAICYEATSKPLGAATGSR